MPQRCQAYILYSPHPKNVHQEERAWRGTAPSRVPSETQHHVHPCTCVHAHAQTHSTPKKGVRADAFPCHTNETRFCVTPSLSLHRLYFYQTLLFHSQSNNCVQNPACISCHFSMPKINRKYWKMRNLGNGSVNAH